MSPAHPKPGKKGKTIGQRSRDQVDAIRDMLYLRDDYRCVVSGTTVGKTSPCTGPITAQHRVGRGAGGSAQFDGPAYLVVMCLTHNVLERRPRTSPPPASRTAGRSAGTGKDVDPAKVPVMYRDGWYLLAAESCMRQRVHPSIAEKLMAQAT